MGKTKNQAMTATSNQGRRPKKEKPTPTTLTKATDDPSVSTPAAQKPVSKQQRLAALLVRDEGATLDQMIGTTGWLPHTTRAALTGLKKRAMRSAATRSAPSAPIGRSPPNEPHRSRC